MITKEEFELLLELKRYNYKWLARNKNSELHAFEKEPFKFDNECWYFKGNGYKCTLEITQFNGVSWIDEEPTSITALITDYLSKSMVLHTDNPEDVVTGNNIEPEHYRTGEIDLFESWYLTYPFEQYRAIMQSHAHKYIMRDKIDRVEDLGKAIYTLERLKEKEIERAEQNSKTIKDAFDDTREAFGGVKTKIAGEYLGSAYLSHEYLLRRLSYDGYLYLARDENNDLFAYEGAPSKTDDFGVWGIYILIKHEHIGNDDLQEVKWTDDEPTKIADLLATYENGGENGK